MIAIIDYGAGSIRSVQNALARLGSESKLTNDPIELQEADKEGQYNTRAGGQEAALGRAPNTEGRRMAEGRRRMDEDRRRKGSH